MEGLRVALTELVVFAIPFWYGLWPRRKSGLATGRDPI
jgi:hypothetical protein